jgi:hypothetical protein
MGVQVGDCEMSVTQLQEIPSKNLILLVGPPGAGKSAFCEQVILQSIAMDRPVIYVTTEYDPSKAEEALRKKGLGGIEPNLLSFVDAFNETVGLSVQDRPDTIRADCKPVQCRHIYLKATGTSRKERRFAGFRLLGLALPVERPRGGAVLEADPIQVCG